jgi:hypothetical protein
MTQGPAGGDDTTAVLESQEGQVTLLCFAKPHLWRRSRGGQASPCLRPIGSPGN